MKKKTIQNSLIERETSRRAFLKKVTATTAFAAGAPSILRGLEKNEHSIETRMLKPNKKVSSNDKIQVALVGAGWRGMDDLNVALKVEGVEVVAACDLYDGRLTRSKELFGSDIFTTRDYKEIIDRSDVDAIIVGTPDHYHSIITVDALNKGKAVYLEKPMVQKIEHGHDIIRAEKSTGKTVQVGSQRVSSIIYEKARDLYKAGEIGDLNFVEGYWDRLSALGAWQYSIPTDASEKTVDWERYVAPTVKRRYDPIRFFRWRNYQDYGTGVSGDLFVHLFSGLHVITGASGPVRVMSSGGLRYWLDGRDVADVFFGIYDYPKTDKHPPFNLVLRVNFADGSGGGSKIRLVGSEGEITVAGDGVTVKKTTMPKAPGYSVDTFAEATQKEFIKEYYKQYPPERPEMQAPREVTYKTPERYDDTYDHFVNFFNSIRTGTKVVENATFGLRAAGPALASNLSYFEKKIIKWDPEKMRVVM